MFKTDTNVPKSELDRRVGALQASLIEQNADAALIIETSDLYYYSGTIQQSHLYVPAQGEPLLMVRKSYARAKAESAIKKILPLKSPQMIPQTLKENGLPIPDQLGLELDVMPVNHFRMYQKIFSKASLLDVSPAIRLLRAVKSDYEINTIRQAAALSDKVTAHTAGIIQPGMTELELAGMVEGYARKLGHQGLVRMRMWGGELFYGHLMTGASAAVASFLASPTGGTAPNPAVAQGAGFTRIKPNEPILLDYVFALNGYIADHARIFAIGSLPDELMAGHAAMLEVQEHIKAAAKPGVTAGDIYDLGLKIATQTGFGDNFMGAGTDRIQFVGHGVGLELDEWPVLAKGQKMPLQAGMVVALEPKLIFPGKGVVGIENTHVVTPRGLEQLGNFPDEIKFV